MQKFFKDNLSVSFGSGTSSSEDLNKERIEDRGRVGGVESVWRDVDGIGSNINLKKKKKNSRISCANNGKKVIRNSSDVAVDAEIYWNAYLLQRVHRTQILNGCEVILLNCNESKNKNK